MIKQLKNNLTVAYDDITGRIVEAWSYDTCIAAKLDEKITLLNMSKYSHTSSKHRNIIFVELQKMNHEVIQVENIEKGAKVKDLIAAFLKMTGTADSSAT